MVAQVTNLTDEEVSPRGIRVNSVAPGFTETEAGVYQSSFFIRCRDTYSYCFKNE
jgi:NAD(P)-dependent dehydrogenase (short-subunit alcohol dehydrogenase family)